MLETVELDIVDVCTPNCYHAAPTVAAFNAGTHVIVEKPCATSVAEVQKMIKVYKAPIDEKDAKAIAEYLSQTY